MQPRTRCVFVTTQTMPMKIYEYYTLDFDK